MAIALLLLGGGLTRAGEPDFVLEPATGSAAGGELVCLRLSPEMVHRLGDRGLSFMQPVQVFFDGLAGDSPVVLDARDVGVLTPPLGATGPVPVSLVLESGEILQGTFTFTAPAPPSEAEPPQVLAIFPDQAPEAGDTLHFLVGGPFQFGVEVEVGGRRADVVSVTPSFLAFLAPAQGDDGDGEKALRVRNPSGPEGVFGRGLAYVAADDLTVFGFFPPRTVIHPVVGPGGSELQPPTAAGLGPWLSSARPAVTPGLALPIVVSGAGFSPGLEVVCRVPLIGARPAVAGGEDGDVKEDEADEGGSPGSAFVETRLKHVFLSPNRITVLFQGDRTGEIVIRDPDRGAETAFRFPVAEIPKICDGPLCLDETGDGIIPDVTLGRLAPGSGRSEARVTMETEQEADHFGFCVLVNYDLALDARFQSALGFRKVVRARVPDTVLETPDPFVSVLFGNGTHAIRIVDTLLTDP